MRKVVALVLPICLSLLLPDTVDVQAGTAQCAPTSIYSESISPGKDDSKPTTKVVSLNMARETQIDRILQEIHNAKALADADVWLLQEVAQQTDSRQPAVKELAGEFNLNYVFAPADVLGNGELLSGLAVLSRFMIEEPRIIYLARHNVRVRNRCRIALEAKLRGPHGTIPVYNVHLDTRITRKQRLDQIRPVIEAALLGSGPAIIGGDFNTSNIRWFWNLLPVPFTENDTGQLRQLFEQHGFGTLDHRGTVGFLWLSLRLDWIFHTGFEPASAGVANIGFSDHDAVWVELSRL